MHDCCIKHFKGTQRALIGPGSASVCFYFDLDFLKRTPSVSEGIVNICSAYIHKKAS